MLSVQKDLDGFNMLFLNEAMEQPRCIEAGPFCLDREFLLAGGIERFFWRKLSS
jgi:hypothetical protein